jgi:hypothetical protein
LIMNLFSLRQFSKVVLFITLACFGSAPAFAEAVPSSTASAYTPEQLEKLVGPIALYPDDLIAITLPSATYPLDIVKAQRFLDARKADPKAPEDKSLAEPVVKLLNYPVVVKMMSDDLDWTQSLGDAVEVDESGILSAIQTFRNKAQAAGNLKSNDKQTVVVEKEIIIIQSTDPQYIYVPTYQPSTVIVYSSTPYVPTYYPAPYPSYYYPYPPGAAFATGLIFGAAIGGAWNTNWGGGDIDIDVNKNNTVNRGGNTVNKPSGSGGGNSNWRNNRAPSQTQAGAKTRQANAGSRPGDASNRGGSQQDDRGGNKQNRDSPSAGSRDNASNRDGSRQSDRGSSGRVSAGSRDSAFGGSSDSGARANRDSARGSSSMSSARSGGGRSSGGRSGGGRSGGGRR